jgi:hypothetical protein
MMRDGNIATLVLIIGLVLAGWSLVRTHRADVMLAENAKGCATDKELAELLRNPPPGDWAAE